MADEKVEENKTERVQLLMTPTELKAIDDWSFENRIRGRAEAMRRLCQIGMGFDANLKPVFDKYNEIGPLILPLTEALITAVQNRSVENANNFADKFSDFLKMIYEHREALGDLGATMGTIKIANWETPPSFKDALSIVKEVREQRKAKNLENVTSNDESSSDKDEKPTQEPQT